MKNPNDSEEIVGLPVRVRRTEYGCGERGEALSVYCPVKERSLPLESCAHCPRFLEIHSHGDGCVSVCCRLAAPVPEEWAQDSDFLAEKMRRTPVREIMSIAVTCVDSELGHEEIEEVFDKTHIHSAPVVEDRGVLIGIVSREDLLRMRPETPGATCCVVDEVMNTRVPKLAESASLADAAIRLAASGTQPLVVVSKDDAVVGTVSPMDLVRWIAGTLAG